MCETARTDAPDPTRDYGAAKQAADAPPAYDRFATPGAYESPAPTRDRVVKPLSLNFDDQSPVARPSLRDRVDAARYRAQRAAEKSAALRELQELLGRNPAVARILELIEATGV